MGSYERKQIAGAVPATTLQSLILSTSETLTLTNAAGWPQPGDPFVLVIDRGLANEEKILVNARTGALLSDLERGYDGTTAQIHSPGAIIEHPIDASTVDQANRLANLLTTRGDIYASDGADVVRVPGPALDGSEDGYALVVDPAEPTGLGWAAQSGAGGTAAPTNLGYTSATRVLSSSTGDDVTLPEVAAGGASGLATGADKTKLDRITVTSPVNLDTIASQVTTALAGDVLTGSGAPTVTPTRVGQVYVDTAALDAYIATGTSSSADWEKSNDGVGAGGGDATDLGYVPSTRTLTSSTGNNVVLPVAAAGGDAGLLTGSDKSKLDGVEAGATADQSAGEIKTAYESNTNTNAYTDAEVAKLAGIAAGAQVNPTAAAIKTAYESNANTNAYTDADLAKLAGIAAGAQVNTVTSVNGQTGAVTIEAGGGGGSDAISVPFAVSSVGTNLAAGVQAAAFHIPSGMTVTNVFASLATASSSGAVTVQILVDGVAMLSTALSIDANETSSATAATGAVIDDDSIPENGRITFNVTGAGTGARGLIVWIEGTAAATAATAPAQVGTVTATPGNGQVVLAWSAPANNGSSITDYVVQSSSSTTFTTPGDTVSDGVSATTGATVTSLTNGQVRYFRVAAVNAVGQGPWSNTVSTTPVAPSGVTLVGTDSRVQDTSATNAMSLNLTAMGAQDGDELILIAANLTQATGDNSPNAQFPATWTEIVSTAAASTGTSEQYGRFAAFRRTLGASDITTTYSTGSILMPSNIGASHLHVLVVRNFTAIEGTPTSDAPDSYSATTTSSFVKPTGDLSITLCCAAAASITEPTGYTNREATADGLGFRCELATQANAAGFEIVAWNAVTPAAPGNAFMSSVRFAIT